MSYAFSSETDEAPRPIVNRRELALQLRISRVTLSAWIDKWSDFPIVERGSNGREYKFDALAVRDFLRAKKEEQANSTAARDAELAQLILPLDLEDQPADPRLSIKDQIEAAKLRRLLHEEAQRTGRLVDAASVSHALSAAFVQLNRALHTAVRQAGRELNLPDSVVRAVDVRVAEAQRAFVKEMSATLMVPGAGGENAA